jgi:2,5-diketo-D-gluconate reductase B
MEQRHVTAAGERIPALGLGTYRLHGQECERVVREAVEMGYRHVDTAEFYDNQRAVGRGLEAASVPREQVWLTTKVWRSNLRREDALHSARTSVERLGVDAVDLLLIHWPNDRVPIEETIGAMNDLQSEGLVRHVGVSNFSVDQLREAAAASVTPIVADQVRYNPDTRVDDLLAYCLDEGVLLTAYTPLAKGGIADDGPLAEIGQRHGKTAAQVALRWLLQQEVVSAIPKASSREHLRENLDVFDFELSAAEMRRIFERRGELPGPLADRLGL